LVDWCQIKLECPTCKQPFQNFRHNIQIRPTCDQIYTPDPPAVFPDDERNTDIEDIHLTVINDNERDRQLWVIRTAARMIVLPMPQLSQVRLSSDPDFRLRFFALLNREFNVNVINIIRRDRG
jgi:E3 ubiquitin-protein ligase Topors